jgi:hypothetical protein
MQRNTIQNTKAKIGQFWASFVGVFKFWKVALIALVLVGSVGGGVSNFKVDADTTNVPQVVGEDYLNVTNCSPHLGKLGFVPTALPIPIGAEVGPCKIRSADGDVFGYGCKRDNNDLTLRNKNILVNCERYVGSGSKEDNQAINSCANFSNRFGVGVGNFEVLIGGRDISFNSSADKTKCQEYFKEFCATYWTSESGSASNFCQKQIGYTSIPNVAKVSTGSTDGISYSSPSIKKCNKLTAAELAELKEKYLKNANGITLKDEDFCKDDNGSIFNCTGPADSENEKTNCIPINETAKTELKGGNTTSEGNSNGLGKVGGEALGGLFSILYKVVITILLIVLILIEYVQMIILTIMAYIISALLDLSPSAPILTKIGLPLWQIFANLANFMVVGFMVYVGAATMIGLRKTEQAGKDIVTIAVLAMLLNTTYFFLNFVISTVDGFARLLITVFVGKGGLFGLFSGLFGLFSKVSVLRDGKGAIDVSNPISAAGNFAGTIGTAFSTATTQFGANDNGASLTFTFLGEALVVISFFIILLIFKDTFVLVFARVTILLLLLITSPVWVVAFFLKDIFKNSSISAAISKLPSQLFGTIVFNFALVLGIIVTVLVTGTAQEGFKGYKLDVSDQAGTIPAGAADAANFLNPNGASLIIAGVVPVFLGVAILYFINNAFKGLIPLLDQVGTAVGNGATDFAKGIISGDVKGGFTKTFKAATTLATGGGQLENIATTAPKLAVKGGVMGLGLAAGTIDNASRFVNLARGRGFRAAGFGQGVANFEEQRLRPFLKDGGFTETVGGALGNNFGKDSVMQQIATQRADYITKEKGKNRENRIGQGLTEAEREWNSTRGRGIVGRNARDTEALENAKGQTAGEKGQIEAMAKNSYYSSQAGEDALRARNLAENQLEQLKTIADNQKSQLESTNKATYYSDPANRGMIQTATRSTIATELNKGIDDSNIDRVKAGLETAFYNTAEGSGLVGENASAKVGAETIRRVTTANRGIREDIGKARYYRSADGQSELETAINSEQDKSQSQTFVDSTKDKMESMYNYRYTTDPGNASKIQTATNAKMDADLNKKYYDVNNATVRAKAGANYYSDPANGAKGIYDATAFRKFGINGLKDAEEIKDTAYEAASSGFQNQEEAYEFDKKSREDAKNEKLKKEQIAKGKAARSPLTPPPSPGSAEEMYAKIYDKAVKDWGREMTNLRADKKSANESGDPGLEARIDLEILAHIAKDPT